MKKILVIVCIVLASLLFYVSRKKDTAVQTTEEVADLVENVSAEGLVNICGRGAIGDAIAIATEASGCSQVSVEKMSRLEKLGLNDRNINSISKNSFRLLSSLHFLSLANSGLSEVPADAFQDLSSLQELDLVQNQITSIHQNAFRGLSSLVYLHLSYNKIDSIPENSFQDLTSLRELNLLNNPISSISKTYVGLSSEVDVRGVESKQ